MALRQNLPDHMQSVYGPRPQDAVSGKDEAIPENLLQALWRYRGFLTVWTMVLVVLAAVIIFTLQPRYRAVALVALDTRQLRFTEVSAAVSNPGAQIDSSFVRSEVQILESDAIARQVVTDLHLDQKRDFAAIQWIPTWFLPWYNPQPPTAREHFEAAVNTYRHNLAIVNDGHSYVISVEYDAADPALAALIANHHAAVYIERQRVAKDRALSTATSWVDREVATLAERLRDSERAVQAYREDHQLYLIKGTSLIEQQLGEVTAELGRARIEVATWEARSQQAGGGFGFLSEVEIAKLREANLQRDAVSLEGQLATTERAQDDIRSLERQVGAVSSLYESLLARQKQIATQIGIQQPDAQVVSPAVEPLRPSFPHKATLLAVVGMVAFSSGSGISLWLNRRRTSVGSLAEAEASTGLPVLAALPRLKGRHSSLPDQVVLRPHSATAEAIRTLRSALAFQAGGTPRTLAVTSALPSEGKTSLTLALARSLAASGLQVILIDFDLRRGRLAQLAFGHPVEQGTAAVLAGQISLSQAVREDRLSSLHILASELAVKAPQDLLEPGRLQSLLATAREHHDYVIVDTPPVGAVSDALLVTRAVDGTLLVLRADSTPSSAVAAAIKMMGMAGGPISGAVLNFSDPRRMNPAGYPMHREVRSYARS